LALRKLFGNTTESASKGLVPQHFRWLSGLSTQRILSCIQTPHHIRRGNERIGAISVPDMNKRYPKADENRRLVDNEIDKVAISRTILRILAHLEKVEYTTSCNERQAEVLAHDDPPNPASEESTTRG